MNVQYPQSAWLASGLLPVSPVDVVLVVVQLILAPTGIQLASVKGSYEFKSLDLPLNTLVKALTASSRGVIRASRLPLTPVFALNS
jgi:hypothetical protein